METSIQKVHIKEKVRVSIIVPVYNKQQYLQKCLRVLLEQSYQNIEIIIVDDGSTDNSGVIADEIAVTDSRVQVIHQHNQGVSVARNTGLVVAQGEWIWFVDADDLPEPNWYVDIISQSEDYDIIFGNFEKYHIDGKQETIIADVVGALPIEQMLISFMEQQYLNGFYGYLWCKLIRRELIERVGVLFETELTLAEDLKFMVELYRRGKPRVVYIPQIAMHYLAEAENSSKEKEIDYKAQLQIQYEIYLWLTETNASEKYQEQIRKQIGKYIAFIFFYAYEQKQDIHEEIIWMEQHSNLRELMITEAGSDIMKDISRLAQQQSYAKLYRYLKNRYRIRKLYRMICKKVRK